MEEELQCDQFPECPVKLVGGKPQDLANGVFSIKTLPLLVGDHHEKEVEAHRLVTHPVEETTVQELVIDDPVTSGVPHHGRGPIQEGGAKTILSCISLPKTPLPVPHAPHPHWRISRISSCISP